MFGISSGQCFLEVTYHLFILEIEEIDGEFYGTTECLVRPYYTCQPYSFMSTIFKKVLFDNTDVDGVD